MEPSRCLLFVTARRINWIQPAHSVALKPFLILSPYKPSRKWSRQVNDSGVLTTSSRKQLRPSAVDLLVTEKSTEEEECSEPESYDDKTSDVWRKTDKKPSNEPFLRTKGQNIVTDNPQSAVVVVSSIIADYLIVTY
jgi:hypothetical protein